MLLASAMLALGPAAQGQTLLDVTGASAIQGTLNSTATPQYGGTLQQVKSSLGKAQSPAPLILGPSGFSPLGSSSTAGPPGGAPTGSSQTTDRAPAAGGAGSAGPGTYVNGRYVAICSHGGLCLGKLERALRRP